MNLISCEKLEKSMVELQFSIDAETFKAAVNNAFKREGKKYAIPGFRKGKAPRHMIEKMYGSDIFHYDAVNDLFPEAYEAAVKEAKIDVVGRPDPEVVSMSEADGVVLKVKVAVKPEVELGEYAGLTVTKEAKNVNEADVDAEVKRMQDRNGRLLTREGAAENGDTVDIDFEGFVDGKAFEGGKAEHYSLVLGSGSFIPGFEDQVVGHSAGEEFDVNVKFPEEYGAAELAGKDATFKIKLHEVKYKELPNGGRKHPQQEFIQINTKNILFICGGAFDGLEKLIQTRTDKSTLGFGSQLRTNLDSEETRQKLLRKVEPDDLVKFGLIPELIGRLPVVTVLDPLDKESLIRVLTEPKNSIVRQYKELLAMDSAELSFTDAALRAIAQKTIARKSGARGLRSVVEDILIPIMYEIPSDPTITRVTIDADTVNGGQPHLEYGAVRKRYKNKAIIKQ